ncbi:MAG TPA: methylmalonyl-CoA mutase family protein, partial [Saprospiraceae bacterium]|nr:methylmalonyl-CoA mutase family protein [Saprospiraceae bacterium]
PYVHSGMTMSTKTQSDWPVLSRETWLAQIQKEVPDHPGTVLIDDGILAHAFPYPDVNAYPQIPKRPGASWCVGIEIRDTQMPGLRQKLLYCLEQGAEYISLILPQGFTEAECKHLLESVYLEAIVSRWTVQHADDHSRLHEFFRQHHVAHLPLYIAEVMDQSDVQFHPEKLTLVRFKRFQIDAWANVLTNLLRNWSVAETVPTSLLAEIHLDHRILLNIAACRAVRAVLQKINSIYELHLDIRMEGRLDVSAQHPDVHTRIIGMGAIALSAATGGVDYLAFPPADAYADPSNLQWIKTTLHLQHILKLESFMDHPADPCAGSYYLEQLTNDIAVRLWNAVQTQMKND